MRAACGIDRFQRAFNLRVTELTGDTLYSSSLRDLASSDLILTTPEKWDSLSRTWRDHLFLMGSVGLLLIDEVSV